MVTNPVDLFGTFVSDQQSYRVIVDDANNRAVCPPLLPRPAEFPDTTFEADDDVRLF
jgi:hypothetical protein